MQIKPPIATELASPQVSMAQVPQTVAACHAVIVQLMEQVKVPEERVHLHSKNSSKPPSSDGPGKPSRAQRRASQRKRGAQPGHKGHSRAMLDEREVDRLMDCKPAAVCEFGGPVELAGAPQRHKRHVEQAVQPRVQRGCGLAAHGRQDPSRPRP